MTWCCTLRTTPLRCCHEQLHLEYYALRMKSWTVASWILFVYDDVMNSCTLRTTNLRWRHEWLQIEYNALTMTSWAATLRLIRSFDDVLNAVRVLNKLVPMRWSSRSLSQMQRSRDLQSSGSTLNGSIVTLLGVCVDNITITHGQCMRISWKRGMKKCAHTATLEFLFAQQANSNKWNHKMECSCTLWFENRTSQPLPVFFFGTPSVSGSWLFALKCTYWRNVRPTHIIFHDLATSLHSPLSKKILYDYSYDVCPSVKRCIACVDLLKISG